MIVVETRSWMIQGEVARTTPRYRENFKLEEEYANDGVILREWTIMSDGGSHGCLTFEAAFGDNFFFFKKKSFLFILINIAFLIFIIMIF